LKQQCFFKNLFYGKKNDKELGMQKLERISQDLHSFYVIIVWNRYIHVLQNYLIVFYSEFLVGPKASAIKVDDLQISATRDKVLEV
jgi:hypothetical protein